MKYISVWTIKPEHMKAAVNRFQEANPEPGKGVKLVSRWHEVGTGKGFALIEADDPIALSRFILAWSDLVDQKLVPVVDDAEIAQAL